MAGDKDRSELLSRRFDPIYVKRAQGESATTGKTEDTDDLLTRQYGSISGWKPKGSGGKTAAITAALSETVETAFKSLKKLEKSIEPLSSEAEARIKDLLSTVETRAGDSSREARSFLSNTLQSLADKIKPN